MQYSPLLYSKKCPGDISLNSTLLIFLGAGIGGVLRYWISNGVYYFLGRNFPYGTLIVNVSGCLLMGFLFVVIVDRFSALSSELRALLLIGFLGGYTTFSTFSIETVTLFENGQWLSGFLNVFLSCTLCLVAAWIGLFLGREL